MQPVSLYRKCLLTVIQYIYRTSHKVGVSTKHAVTVESSCRVVAAVSDQPVSHARVMDDTPASPRLVSHTLLFPL